MRSYNTTGVSPLLLQMILLEDFNQMTENNFTLEENEAFHHHSEETYEEPELIIADKQYQLRETEGIFGGIENQLTESMLLVLPSLSDVEAISTTYETSFPETNIGGLAATIGWNTSGSPEEKEAYAEMIRSNFEEEQGIFLNYESRKATEKNGTA